MIERRSARRVIIIIAAAVVLLSACGGVAYYMLNTFRDSDKHYEAAFLEYADCLIQGDYERLYSLTTKTTDEEEFLSRHTKIYSGIEASDIQIEFIDLEKPVNDDSEVKSRLIAYYMSMDTIAGRIELNNTAVIVAQKEGKQTDYLLEWGHDIIFPNLSEEDTVSVKKTSGRRGIIYDRNGEVLAGPGIVKSVGLITGKMKEDPSADIEQMAQILDISAESIYKKINEKWVKPEHFVPIKSISAEDVESKEALLAIEGSGILINDETDRVYPLGEAAAHLTGYIQSVTAEDLQKLTGYNSTSKIGKLGVEALLEDKIRGIDGYRIVILDKDGREKQTLAEKEQKHGEDVYLTIDSALQTKLYELLKEDKASATVIDPFTGEVLALVSTPAYDPNEFILGVPETLWDSWNTDERRPLYNRFKATYSPGSSFKPIIAAIGLSTGAITADENLGYTGKTWQKDSTWGKYYITTLKEYGSDVTLINAMVNSDNIYFARAALKIGEQSLTSELKKMGFGEALPFSFGINPSTFGTSLEFGSEIELADSGYGQGRVQVSTLFMASAYSAFLNDGSMIEPELILGDITTFWKPNVFTADAANTVRKSLIQVVESPEGTAHEIKHDEIIIGGKTGTAEIKDSKDDEEGTELGWFAAFITDTETPYIFVAMVEDVKGRGGSHYVTPIAREILTQ